MLAAKTIARIPIAHCHGGELTKSTLGDSLRHAITQLSSWHLTAAEPYRQRVIAVGQQPEWMFTVVPMVLDGHLAASPASRSAFEQATGFRFAERKLLITVTARKDDAPAAVQAAMANVIDLDSISRGGGLIQTTSG